jgi:hypothetical protein
VFQFVRGILEQILNAQGFAKAVDKGNGLMPAAVAPS